MNSSLAGKRVLNTRAFHHSEALNKLLQAAGAIPVPFPCIDVVPLDEPGELDAALQAALDGAFDWLVFTSVNTVCAVESRCRQAGLPPLVSAPCKIAAVGSTTAEVFERAFGRPVDLIPSHQNAAALARELPLKEVSRVLIPASSRARPELAAGLRARGASVVVARAYKTVSLVPAGDVRSRITTADAVIFASPSAVTGFTEAFALSGLELSVLDRLVIACIGPTTIAAAEAQQLPDPCMAHEPGLAGIIQALQTAFESRDV